MTRPRSGRSALPSLGLLLGLSIGLALAPPRAAAGPLSTALGQMIGAHVHVNPGGPLETARRGGFYGGSVHVRGKVVDIAVLNFTPPSFASGCGGIDMFGGSFSMINAAQFTQLLQAIAQNAAGYAFQLALKNICEQCATIMAGLQKTVQAMNEFTGNSCQLAQGIVNDTLDALEMKDAKGMSSASVTQGWTDAWGGFWDSLSATVTALDVPGPGGNIYEDRYEVNVTWKAIDDIHTRYRLPAGQQGFRQWIMGLFGTVILKGPVADADGNPSRLVQPMAGQLITIRDLVYGNDAAQYYKCDEFTRCLAPTVESYDLKGLVEHLEALYVGTGPTDPEGVIYQLVNGPPAQKQAAMDRALTGLGATGAMIIRLAAVAPPGSTGPWMLFDRHKEFIAVELAALFVQQTQAAVEQELQMEPYHSSHAEVWRRGAFRDTTEALARQLSDLHAGVARPDPEDFIRMFEYFVNTNPFVD